MVAAIVIAAVSFSLLTSAVASSRLQVRGKIAANFRSAYDILVRPKGSQTPLEASDRLVQENYLSGIFGGITMRQYHLIRNLDGVQVAAPIAMVGYTLPSLDLRFAINKQLDTSKTQQLLRVDFNWGGDRGLSTYPSAPRYFYVTSQPWLHGHGYHTQRDPITGRPVQVCPSYEANLRTPTTAFPHEGQLICWSTTTPGHRLYGLKRGQIGSNFLYPFPLMIAAVDPKAEAQLVGLDKAVVVGRYLHEGDGVTTRSARPSNPSSLRYRQIPMLMSHRLVSDQDLHLVISRVGNTGPERALPSRLTSKHAAHWLAQRPTTVLRTERLTGASLYPKVLARYARKDVNQFPAQYWSAGQVSYTRQRDGHLQPNPKHNGPFTWVSSTSGFYAPAQSADVGFRKLTVHETSNKIYGSTFAAPVPRVVGQFDPRKIEGFSSLSKVPLTTYFSPSAFPADARTRRLLHGKSLLPSNNLAGYLQQPPLLLTNLKSLPALYNPASFTTLVNGEATSGNVGRAPISVIRVRVEGVTGADPASRERVKLVAEQIARRTGLDVDITVGTSPTPELIDLPAGNHGRPELTLKEGWVKKGVAVQLLSAIDNKSLSLFALVLLVCGLFLLNAVTAAVRARAAELGILSCLGWTRGRIFWLLEIELLLTGVIAGLAGTGIASVIVRAAGLSVSWWQLVLISPVAVLLAGLAGLPPTRKAANAIPMQAIQPAIRTPRHARSVTSITRLGLVGVGRTPGRSALAAASLFIGVAALAGLLAIQQQFSRNAVGTLLGNVVAIQVRGVDLLAVILVLALGGFTIADVAYLNISERHAEIGTLRATGWTERHVQRLFATEALTLATVGAVSGAVLGVSATALLLHPNLLILVRAATIATAGGVAAATIALTVPLAQLGKLAPAGMLEE
ncbi:MAG: FtsX-like permease family protein [Nocardioides sp.]|nr:FtsX-like permease family protein [Nocardioides sp.]